MALQPDVTTGTKKWNRGTLTLPPRKGTTKYTNDTKWISRIYFVFFGPFVVPVFKLKKRTTDHTEHTEKKKQSDPFISVPSVCSVVLLPRACGNAVVSATPGAMFSVDFPAPRRNLLDSRRRRCMAALNPIALESRFSLFGRWVFDRCSFRMSCGTDCRRKEAPG